MSVRLKDTIYDLINNSDKLDGKHAADFATSGHTHYSLSTPGDQRSVTTTPNTYSNKFIFQGLKTNSTFGKPSTDTYSYVMGLRGWSDSSGGNSWEIAFNNSGINVRNGATDTWSNWFNVLTSNNSEVSLSGSTLTVKINGVTKSLTNTNTTYSAGSGLSLSGTTFNHASTVTAGTAGTSSATSGSTLAVPYVTYNATGHITATGTHTHTITGFAASSHTHSTYLPKLRMENPDPGHASIGAIPFILSLKAAGTPLYGDPEFASGNNSVNVYNIASNGAVTITRIADNQYSANSSGYILQISTSATTATPGRGGFVQNMTSRAGAIFCQIFRAKIPTGYTLANTENSMGSSYKTHWLTSKAGTGKWEWYCRVTFCGTSGTFSSGGHVYLNADAGGTAAVTWYLSYCNTIDLTKGNYDGLRSIYSDKLGTNAGSATKPVYFSGGKPVACTYSLNKTVPSDAKFTDTTYSAGSGLSLSGTTFNHAATVTAGTAGTSSATSGSTLAVPYVTVNATGHVTGYGTHTHTITGFAASSHTHSYLPLSGGTITGTLQIKKTGSAIQYLNASGTVWGWMGYDAENKATVWNSDGSTKYTILHSGNYTSYAPSLNHAYGYVMKMTTIDVSSLNVDTYYPVIIPVSPYNKTSVRIEVEVSLNSGTKPSWSTHNSGFSVRKVWETNGSGWGTATVSRRVIVSTYGFASSDPVRGIGQMTNSSNEYVYVRGGGKYFFFTSHGVTPSLKTSTYTASSQSVAPTTTAPAAISESYSYVGHTHNYAAASHTHSQYYDSGISRTANTVLAAPNGSAGSATFRKLVAADIPALAISKITNLQSTLDGKAAASHTHNYAAASHTHNYAGSSSAGGAATSANKLNTNAGSATKPVYFSGGVPVAITAPMVQYWAIYEIFWGSGGSLRVKKAGNFDFLGTIITHELVGAFTINVNYPTGFSEQTTMIFANGDHVGSDHTDVGYVTINKLYNGSETSTTGKMRLSFSDDASTNWGYAFLYFLCIG